MNEAGKPENWAWMGFEKSSSSSKSKDRSDSPNSTTNVDADSDSESPANKTPGLSAEPSQANNDASPSIDSTTRLKSDPSRSKVSRSETNPSKPIRLTEYSPDLKQTSQPTALPTESAKFWSSFFASLETAEQVDLISILEASQDELPPAKRPAATTAQTNLVARAEQQYQAFNNKILDRLQSIPHGTKKRSQVSQDLIDADKFWKRISPALTAFLESQDITLVQRQAVVDLLHHLDVDALTFVQDKTAVGWTGDSVAWKRSWNLIHQTKIGEPTFAKRIQLIGQPREFRGKPVKVYGFVRDIETRTAAPNSSIAGQDAEIPYYILWVEPSDSDAGPYCIYSLNVPAELPRSRDELVKYQQLATFNGIFFKNRTYQAADRTVQYCPLILTDGFEVKPPPLKLSRTWMTAALALVPILGVGIVWYAVRSTVGRKRLPSKKSQEETNAFLGDLKNDPSIKTDLENIQAIAEHEDDIL